MDKKRTKSEYITWEAARQFKPQFFFSEYNGKYYEAKYKEGTNEIIDFIEVENYNCPECKS